VAGRMVRVDDVLYERFKEYEVESGVPITRAVNEAAATFIECVLPPRLEFFRSQRTSQVDTSLKSA